MQITLNDQNLDFSLEQEETISDIVEGLKTWLESSGFILTGLKKDGEMLSLEDADNWGGIPIQEVKTLSVETRTKAEVGYEMLDTVFEFFSLLEKGLKTRNSAVIDDLMKEYPDIRISLELLLPNSGSDMGNSEVVLLNSVLEENGLLSGTYGDRNLKKVISIVKQVKTIILGRMREISNPVREILTSARLLDNTIAEICDVSVLLQTGKDQQAMNAVVRFTELSQKLIRLYPLLEEAGALDTAQSNVDGLSFEDFYSRLNNVLRELLSAFEVKDSVLIGDLLEYEVAPQLEQLIILLNAIQNEEEQ